MSSAPDYLTQDRDVFAIDAIADERAAFIRRTYAHVFGSVVALAGLMYIILQTPALSNPLVGMVQNGQFFLIFLGYMAASWVAQKMAASGASTGTQYVGLALYTVAEAVIFTPLIYSVYHFGGGGDVILQAGALTLFIFGGLTAVVMLTKQDFSFLRNILWLAGLAAFGLIAVSFFTTLVLGTWFVIGMIVLMAGFILYDTSNVLHHYRTDQHVAAALALFASLATLFWYVLILLNNRR
jgi:FtsH-binding integral membrane protein